MAGNNLFKEDYRRDVVLYQISFSIRNLVVDENKSHLIIH